MRRLAYLLAIASRLLAQPGVTVSGRVLNSVNGTPIAGAEVTLSGMEAPARGTPQTYIVDTDSDGRFSIPSAAPGVYAPRPKKIGYELRPLNRFLIVEPGQPAAIELRLTPDAAITGRVLDAEGDPIRSSTVEAMQYSFTGGKRQVKSIRKVMSDDHGTYRLFNLPAGRYYLRAQHSLQNCFISMATPLAMPQCRDGLVTLGPAFYPSAAEISRATQVTVGAGAELAGIDLRLGPRALYTIHGKFVGAPASRQSTTLLLMDSEGKATTYDFDIAGDEFAFKDVPPGSYRLVADFAPDQNSAENHVFATQPVEVVNHDVDAPLAFRKGRKITGTAQLEGGAPARRNELEFIRFTPLDGGVEAEVTVKPDGSPLEVSLAPGAYRVDIVRPPGIYLKTVLAAGQALPDRKLDADSVASPLTIVAGADLGAVEGAVLDESGKPVYNAEVTMVRDGEDNWANRFQSMITKSDGKFRFKDVVPGEYKAYAWFGAPPGETQDPEFRKPYESQAVIVKVTPTDTPAVQLKVIVVAPKP